MEWFMLLGLFLILSSCHILSTEGLPQPPTRQYCCFWFDQDLTDDDCLTLKNTTVECYYDGYYSKYKSCAGECNSALYGGTRGQRCRALCHGFLKSFCQLLDSEGFDKACLNLSTRTPAQIEYQDLPTLPLVDKHNPVNFKNHTKQVVQADEQEASSVLAMLTLCGVVGILLVVVSAVLMITSCRCLKSKEQRKMEALN